jgi:chitin disaccharide deacetylase
MSVRVLELCADDYGQSAAINAGILQLAQKKRLSAVSCMVNGPAWDKKTAQALGAQKRNVGAGLHFNLTEGVPLSAALRKLWPQLPSLQQIITWAHLRRLPEAALRDEWQAQWLAFESVFGRAPSHIDGHQHVHHMPQVRELLMEVLAQHPGVPVRHTGRVKGPGFGIKRLLIEGTGGRELGRQLEAQGRAANSQLLGVYDFQGNSYRAHMQAWLAALPTRGAMIFCHPGVADPGHAADPIASARVLEFAYLNGDDFGADLKAAKVQLA